MQSDQNTWGQCIIDKENLGARPAGWKWTKTCWLLTGGRGHLSGTYKFQSLVVAGLKESWSTNHDIWYRWRTCEISSYIKMFWKMRQHKPEAESPASQAYIIRHVQHPRTSWHAHHFAYSNSKLIICLTTQCYSRKSLVLEEVNI